MPNPPTPSLPQSEQWVTGDGSGTPLPPFDGTYEREVAMGTCENLAHDSKPQEWHPRNASCIGWRPVDTEEPSVPASYATVTDAHRKFYESPVSEGEEPTAIEFNGFDGDYGRLVRGLEAAHHRIDTLRTALERAHKARFPYCGCDDGKCYIAAALEEADD